jgi:hypothetical protein
MPTDREDVMNLAIPLALSGKLEAFRSGTPPSNKVTVPVGVQLYCGATFTVNVTIC